MMFICTLFSNCRFVARFLSSPSSLQTHDTQQHQTNHTETFPLSTKVTQHKPANQFSSLTQIHKPHMKNLTFRWILRLNFFRVIFFSLMHATIIICFRKEDSFMLTREGKRQVLCMLRSSLNRVAFCLPKQGK